MPYLSVSVISTVKIYMHESPSVTIFLNKHIISKLRELDVILKAYISVDHQIIL